MSMRIAICDDDKLSRDVILQRIKNYNCPDKIHLFEYSSGEKLIKALNHIKPDIVFLDVKMSGIDGLETAKQARLIIKDLIIILLTAYIDYSQKGYLVEASGFILKDHIESDFDEVFSHAIDKHKKNQKAYITVVAGRVQNSVNLKNIIYFESEDRKIRIHTTTDSLDCYKKLDDLERELESFDFIRCHKSFLVNYHFIERVSRDKIFITNCRDIPISRSHRDKVSRIFTRISSKEML